jgi:hypothetical protein
VFFANAYLANDNKRKLGWLLVGYISLFGSKIQVYIGAILMVFLLFFDEQGGDLLSRIGSLPVSRFTVERK